ncbi:MAG: F0F1 ATP synthase subunit B' [Proteobacteria bacterium]|nr:F0F1 ATP synthase subunit B' [Pseudomonadota bacterium]
MRRIALRLAACACGLLASAAIAAEHEKGGLPQLDAHGFPGQIFWLAVTFILFYVFVARVALPRIGKTLAARALRIQGQIAEAERIKNAAAAALADYEKARADSRAKAQAEVNAALQLAATEAAKREAVLAQSLGAETKKAEARLAEAKAEAIRNLGAVALEVTRLAAERLIGVNLAEGEAKRAVDSVLAERGR